MIKMKSFLKITIIIFLSAGIIPIMNFCKKEIVPTLPVLTTVIVSGISPTAAVSGGNITSDGSASITTRGVCWATSTNPTVAGSHTTDGTGTGSFTSNLSGLSAGITYYERAYAINSAGTAYGNQLTFNTMIADIDGNLYNIVTIGTQVWLKENLKVTKYQDGTVIPNISDNTAWSGLSNGAYCWYNNTSATYKDTYGALYNWYTLSSGILCPTGWHAPTDAEWHQLILFLDPGAPLSNPESLIAGNKLKESGTSHWQSPNSGATNENGFTALPGGSRDINGAFSRIGTSGFWWGSDNGTAWYRDLDYNYAGVIRVSPNKKNGLSVRCLKN